MLHSMFNNKNRPFYNSCETIYLDRISKDDYGAFIQKAALDQWERLIPEEVLEELFLENRTPSSYVNSMWTFRVNRGISHTENFD